MTSRGFDINVTADHVDVQRDPRPSSRSRFAAALFLALILVVFVCAILFLPGKHGRPSLWSKISNNSATSFDYLLPLLILLFVLWASIRWLLATSPADDALHCDQDLFTVSRARWLDTHNQLVPKAYPLSRISNLRFGIIASSRGQTVYGLLFKIDGKNQTLLAGLEAPEAKAILIALKALGADVPDDPKLEKRIHEASPIRDGDTTWMDRSWMDKDKQ